MPPSEVTSSRPPSTRGIGLMVMKRLPALRGRRSSKRLVFGVVRSGLIGSAQVFAGRAVAQINLPRCNFVAMNQTAIEAQVIGATDARAQHCHFTVDGDAAGADPLLRFAT